MPSQRLSISLLDQVNRRISNTPLGLGEQDVTFWEDQGFNKGQADSWSRGFDTDVAGIMLGVIGMESKEVISTRFTDSMVAQIIPTLGQLGVGNGRTGNDCLVVDSKQPGRTIKANLKGTKG